MARIICKYKELWYLLVSGLYYKTEFGWCECFWVDNGSSIAELVKNYWRTLTLNYSRWGSYSPIREFLAWEKHTDWWFKHFELAKIMVSSIRLVKPLLQVTTPTLPTLEVTGRLVRACTEIARVFVSDHSTQWNLMKRVRIDAGCFMVS